MPYITTEYGAEEIVAEARKLEIEEIRLIGIAVRAFGQAARDARYAARYPDLVIPPRSWIATFWAWVTQRRHE